MLKNILLICPRPDNEDASHARNIACILRVILTRIGFVLYSGSRGFGFSFCISQEQYEQYLGIVQDDIWIALGLIQLEYIDVT